MSQTKPSTPESDLGELCVTRQPVMDTRKILQAYELMFSSKPENIFDVDPEDEALEKALEKSLLGSTRESLTEGLPFFVRVNAEVVLNKRYRTLPAKEAILMLSTTMESSPEVLAELQAAKNKGYQLALEDFATQRGQAELLALVDIVRLNFLEADAALREECALVCSAVGARPLAAGVETREDFELAHGLGYQMFQGYFLLRPDLIDRSAVPGFKVNYMRFFQQVNAEEMDFKKIEDVIKSEVSLSLRLLRYLNTASFNWRKEVSSIRQALVLLGERQLRRWASLLAVAGLGEDQPLEAARACLIRARFCELVARHAGLGGRELDLFFCGLLSGVDVLVGRPIDELLEDLSVADDIKDALLGESSELGPVLQLVLAYEEGDWDQVAAIANSVSADGFWINPAYVEAARWADDVIEV